MESSTLLAAAEAKENVPAGRAESEQSQTVAPEVKPVVPETSSNIEYKDVGMLGFITNSVVADLIRMARNALKQGRELRFINVPATLKAMIRKLGLSEIIKCS
jgi:ABC-type transporter Mla MlaB component